MELDELLNEAKQRYPIGCKVRSAYDKTTIGTLVAYIVCTSTPTSLSLKSGDGFLYYYNNGDWAEIISYPKGYIKDKVINNYDLY